MTPKDLTTAGMKAMTWSGPVSDLDAGGSAASGVPTRSRAVTAIVLAGLLGVVATSWVVAIHQMKGMDNGTATQLGSFAFFMAVWVAMMAAMMLPGAAPAVLRHLRTTGRVGTVPVDVASYLAIWTLVGIAAYSLYQPHGTAAAGVIVIAAGVYELTPMKRHARVRCQESVRTGLGFGVACLGSSIGLMAMLLAVGAMSITWMIVIGVVVLAQKLLPPNVAIDVWLALAIIGVGILIVASPATIPGLMPSM
jgi:predicted metal-binding membrane protein